MDANCQPSADEDVEAHAEAHAEARDPSSPASREAGSETSDDCWGKRLMEHFAAAGVPQQPCSPGFAIGKRHLRAKFCARCKTGFSVPLTHVRAIVGETCSFANNRSGGLWTDAGGQPYRVFNNASACKGPLLILFGVPPPEREDLEPVPGSDASGLMSLTIAYDSLVPASSVKSYAERQIRAPVHAGAAVAAPAPVWTQHVIMSSLFEPTCSSTAQASSSGGATCDASHCACALGARSSGSGSGSGSGSSSSSSRPVIAHGKRPLPRQRDDDGESRLLWVPSTSHEPGEDTGSTTAAHATGMVGSRVTPAQPAARVRAQVVVVPGARAVAASVHREAEADARAALRAAGSAIDEAGAALKGAQRPSAAAPAAFTATLSPPCLPSAADVSVGGNDVDEFVESLFSAAEHGSGDTAAATQSVPSVPPSPPEDDALRGSTLATQAAPGTTLGVAALAVCLPAMMHATERGLAFPATWIAIACTALPVLGFQISPDDARAVHRFDSLFVTTLAVFSIYNTWASDTGFGGPVAMCALLYRLLWPRGLPPSVKLERLWLAGNYAAFVIGVLYVWKGLGQLSLLAKHGCAAGTMCLGEVNKSGLDATVLLPQLPLQKASDKAACGLVFTLLSVVFSNANRLSFHDRCNMRCRST